MKVGLTILLLLAAAASVVNLVLFALEHMMDPRWAGRDGQLLLAFGVIGAVTVAGVVLAFRHRAPGGWLIGAAVLVAIVGFVPRVIYEQEQREVRGAQAVVDRDFEAKLLAEIETRSRDIESRIVAQRPFTPDEAEALIKFVRDANLDYRKLADHTPKAMPLLQRALEGKVFDPNAPVPNRFRRGAPPEPLFLQFHKTIRQAPERSVLTHDWNIMLLLVANGADLSAPGADALAADLRKTAIPVHSGLYIELK